MKEETKLLPRISSAGEYLAPKIKVHEIKARTVLCTSPGMQTYDDGGNIG